MGVREVSSSQSVADVIAGLTREVPDFPEPGIQFKDLTPVLADTHGFAVVTSALAEIADGADLVAGIDARGFLLGGAVAHRLGIGVLAIRKGGKLPPPVHSQTYDLEYGTATLEIPADGIDLRGRRIVIIDDVLATAAPLRRHTICWSPAAPRCRWRRWCWNWAHWADARRWPRCRCAACAVSEAISSLYRASPRR